MIEKPVYVTRSSLPAYEEYIEMIRPMWENHRLTNMGEYHQRLEEKLKDFLQISNISLMVNGHTALEMAIQAMDFPKGSEIITTPFTFISTTHAIIRNGMVPVFCDIKLSDFTIDENKIENLITDKTVAILPVHVYGNVCNYTRIDEISKKYNLKVLYDAAHTFGERIDDSSVESLGDVSVLSFHATKVFNTIEGGAVCFKDEKLYQKLYNLKNFGIRSEEIVEAVGANGKMNEFCAAMGICNLRHIRNEIKKRENNTLYYDARLSLISDITVRKRDPRIDYNYGYYPVLFVSEDQRNRVYEKLKENNIYARKYFYPITSDQKCFLEEYKDVKLENARDISKRILTLPLYSDLEECEIEKVCNYIKLVC
ncbi:MAG: aminotransferase DegT/DnrJ/EryC1/StrS family [Herbinix sp.]|jgi:dTDP-4-amino-4,6-dideoxygalactose transaminase|nr:aminotransferase DegT/DnrJ/EryC1/StrS family [Herbinix sp.]